MAVVTASVFGRPARAFVTDFSDFDRPWRLLAELAPDLRVHELAFGAGYLALARAPDR